MTRSVLRVLASLWYSRDLALRVTLHIHDPPGERERETETERDRGTGYAHVGRLGSGFQPPVSAA